MNAIAPHFLGKFAVLDTHKTELFEKFRMKGKGENPSDAEITCKFQQMADQKGAQAIALVFCGDGQRTDFREVVPKNLQASASYHAPFVFGYHKVSQPAKDSLGRKGEHLFFLRILINEFQDLRNVRCPSFPKFYGMFL